ncbi:hypothetical protein F4818DRAFT_439356 [Hypoxylon cercidicola]|nr:hypothetical protein F4818DRAFT_439356 [Hypoxylon cercidicola]
MHYGISHPNGHLVQDQAALGVDTFLTFSTDMMTQARIWLQRTRSRVFDQTLQKWQIPVNNLMSVNHLPHGHAARRPRAPAPRPRRRPRRRQGRPGRLRRPLARHAGVGRPGNVGDVEHVMVDGEFRKRDRKLTFEGYGAVVDRFLASAAKLQKAAVERPDPVHEGRFWGGCAYGRADEVNISRGPGTGYGAQFVHRH